ncbi:MAG: GAF domain-containing protein [Chloroflexi bacterium]|nr:MAG: GAF domain-containing protein [Chloroflexota bacterium]
MKASPRNRPTPSALLAEPRLAEPAVPLLVRSFVRLTVAVAALIFIVEAALMLLLPLLPPLPRLVEALLDSTLLVLLISPVLYLLFRTINRQMAEWQRIEEVMRKFFNAVEQAADAVVITDREGVIEYVNPAFEQITGYSRQEALGKTPRILKSGQHGPEFYQELWQTILAGEPFHAVFVNRRKNGELYYDDKVITPVKDRGGRVAYFIATGRDITEHRRMEEWLRAIYRLGRELILLRDEAVIVQRVLETAANVLRCEVAGYGVVDNVNRTLTYRYRLVQGQAEAIERSLPLAGEGEIGVIAARSGQIVRVANAAPGTPFALLPEALSYHSQLCVPMRVGGQVIGVLVAASFEPDRFGEADEQLLQTLADQVAVALENARLFAEAQESLEALRRAYGELGREAWAKLLHVRPDLGFRSTEHGVTIAKGVWRPEMEAALREGRTVQANGAGGDARLPLAVPIKVRGQVVGVLDTYKPDGAGGWTSEEVALLEAIADQLGVALESARLFEETQRRAWREQLIGQITARIREAGDVEGVLQTAAEELGKALNAARSHVALQVPEESEPAPS